MIKRKKDRKEEKRENMRGGKGRIKIRHYFDGTEMNAPCRLCAELILEPGAEIGPHEHVSEDEVFIVHSGRGVIIDGTDEYAVEPGDSVLTGKGASHSVRNTGDGDLVMTAIIMLYGR